jgi:hypothetical protein
MGSVGFAQQVQEMPTGTPGFAHSTEGISWVGVAVSSNKRVFRIQDQGGETSARAAVRNHCEQTTGRTCKTMAVPASWDVVILNCAQDGRSDLFLGGSNQGYARDIAIDKAAASRFLPSNCSDLYNY